ncbi:hypothetical protein [Rhodococcus sp. YH1]|uniref:hypothetical protein n=1 Tax=Rhodococcus sp. YH1 TaxID=89066 RepID=UPI001EE499DF
MDVPNLDATPVVPKTGDEPLHESGRLLGQHLRDFWAWAYSDLLGNAMRGVLAEYLVGTALGCVHGRTRLEWDAWDLRTVDGIRLEIKSAAYLQSWRQSAYSRIGFDIRPTTAWYAETNTYSSDRRRQADVYVFCLFAHRGQGDRRPARRRPVAVLRDEHPPARRDGRRAEADITRGAVAAGAPGPSGFGELRGAVEAVSAGPRVTPGQDPQ